MKKYFVVLGLFLLHAAAKAQTITEVFFPQYVQGTGDLVAADDRKVPFVCRMTLSGLIPNATYRFYNRFTNEPSGVNNGVGNYILVKDTGSFLRVTLPSLVVVGRYGEFTTDTTGSYTGWFVNEVTSSTAFIPGTSIYFRIMLNDGAGGGFVATRLTSTNPVKVINFGTTTDSLSGTGIRCTPLKSGSAKQFIFLYDNILGQFSGRRPVTGTFIESDGTENNIANGYAPFYADSVNNSNKAWGTIIPNGLPNGILHIAQYSLKDGQYAHFPYLSFDGKWPSVNRTTANTKNATGGLNNVLVIDGSRLSIINLWLNGEAVTDETITMEWNTYDASNAREYVVEKSTDGGKTFALFSTVKAQGNKPVYQLNDTRSENTAYYRVTLVNKDGVKLTSEVLSIQGVVKLNVYPNPVTNKLVMQHPQAEAGATVQVVGIDGRQLFTQNVQHGAVQTNINVSKLIPGNYMIILNMNGQRQSKSFIKK